MSRVFISYATPDYAFVRQLATHLEAMGHYIWIDRWRITTGDSLLRQLSAGLEQADFVVVVFSQHTLTSAWVEREWQSKFHQELASGREMLLPALLEDCALPVFLRDRRYADFRDNYALGLAQLAVTLHHSEQAAPSSPKNMIVTRTVAPDDQLTDSDNPLWYNRAMQSTAIPKEISVELGIPYLGKITGVWKPDEKERAAAWELYIELVTRVGVAGLEPEEGLLREGLSSLYVIFTTTRDILRRYGPGIARPHKAGDISLGILAIHILNFVLRPVLSKWHPLLLDYEQRRDPALSVYAHEHAWEKEAELRQALEQTRVVLLTYASLLAQVADIPEMSVTP